MELAGVLAPVVLGLGLCGLALGRFFRRRLRGLALRTVKVGGRNKHRHRREFVLSCLVTWRDEHLGIEVGIRVLRDLAKLQGVLIAVVGDDMNVRAAAGDLGLNRDKTAGDMATIEDPARCVAAEHGRDLLLGW